MKLNRENSQKVFLKNTSLSTYQQENLNEQDLTITDRDKDGSSLRTIVHNAGSEGRSRSIKIDRVSGASTPNMYSENCKSPAFFNKKNIEFRNSNGFETSSNLNASPSTKKIIMEQAQNIQSLQNQIFELQKLVTGGSGPISSQCKLI